MSSKIEPGDLELTDSELLDVVKNHATGRRSVMAALGVGTLATLGAGTAAAKHDRPHPPHIDEYYGYSAPADERVPRKLRPDHTVGLHVDFDPPRKLPFHFDKMGLHIDEGDVIRFDFESPEHTITAYHEGQHRQQRVPDANVPFSSPVISDGGFWLYRFDYPGTYDLFCAPHEFFGMVMRVVVGDPDDTDYDDEFGAGGPPPAPRPPVSPLDLGALGISLGSFTTAGEILGVPTPPGVPSIPGSSALTVANIVDNGPILVGDVEDTL